MRKRTLPMLVLALSLTLGVAACSGGETSDNGGDTAAADTGGGGQIGDIDQGDTGGGIDTGGGGDTDTTGGDEVDGGDPPDTGGGETDTGGGGDCPGGPGCACDSNAECDAALCIWTASGKTCAQTCIDTCPTGMVCEQVPTPGGDSLFACVSKQLTLCAPCSADSDCVENGIVAACVDYGDAGKFCGAACDTDADCPGEYACTDVGGKAKQCKKKPSFTESSGACANDGECKEGEVCSEGKCGTMAATCGCSPWAVASGNKTPCSVSNEFGTCQASRACTADGLEACPAATAKVETCNAIDDDCDGTTDDLPPEATCSKQAFLDKGSKAPCTKDEDCTEADEKCDEAKGTCLVLLGECFGTPTCSASGQLICNDVKTPKAELCNLEDDDCDGSIDEDYAYEGPDGAKSGVGEACGTGACGGGKVVCANLSTASCDAASKAKGETCNAVDDDCDGETDDVGEVCVDGNLCTKDICDGSTQTCTNPPSVDCDDGNPCTTEACDTKGGTCVVKFYEGSCDDGDACTVGDACGKNAAGDAICLPGTTTKTCDDGNVCTDDACDSKVGCVGLPNAQTVTCYDGPEGTAGVGLCVAGYRACKDGKLTDTCFTQITPATKEDCDAKDDDCDGVVDNGCGAASAHVRMAGAAGRAEDKNLQLGVHAGSGAILGSETGDKNKLRMGWMAWVRAVTGL